ncbi:Proprotein convertase subtilisin/kexin type 6 [Mizuhopecten yessoensis]|uniref:Proprotein convertase subtilisin/kexin type 6 n=1 Tax=Mizuhopecten yessoensis TaxID=6573 RepID=A0A210QIA6_MIZYE|nr:Proprotein convertase subtilisin/kexin type 6 [Mizuhopecten yessoensis]
MTEHMLLRKKLASGVYLNEIAVHVPGGRSVVDRIADRHGFINRGQIGNLKDHYLLEHPHIHKRSTSPSHVHHARFSQEPEILWFEQQFVKKRVKRDLTFTDPLWVKQWYLYGGGRRGRNGPGGFDMGVAGAWKMGYSGKGVVITILDDGIERDHPDLIGNYDPYASTDINGHDSDPMPRYDFSNENRHGTRCAGEVAAKANNSNCIVGVAFNSGIGGVRMLDGNVYDKVEADSLSHNHTHVDIYSASWGPDDDGRVVDGPGPLAKKSFVQGIKTGRGNKGNIFMWASGNGGRAEDSCSCDGYTNSIYTLSISSTSQNGGKPWYLEECSSTLATTYSSGAPDEHQIITTDLRKRCTETHTGTSASAPLAAGLVALALEANPSLTWRDVQYITLLSANPEPMADGQWRENGMGRKVSLRYGYGLMNATGMVYLAERWTTVPAQHICTINGSKQNVPLYKYTMFENQVTTDGCAAKANEVRYLEHVHVKITLNYKRRGDLSINLVSPSGTNSTILPKRNRDMSDGGFKGWEFLSVHFWEENPAGSWKLVIVDQINPYAGNDQQGTLVNWSLVLYGTKDKPVNLKEAPSSVTPTYTCHSECVDTCKGPNPEDCTSCKHYRITDGPCVERCPTAYRVDRDLCVPCSTNCQYCVTVPGSREHCRQCKGGLFSIENEGTCVSSCPVGYFRVGTSSVCRKCSQQCESCEGTSSHCLKCVAAMVLKNNKCVLPPTLCPEGLYKNRMGHCQSCDPGCRICDSPGQCVYCKNNFSYIQNGRCVTSCEKGYLPHVLQIASHRECRKCNQGVCNSCANGFRMSNSVCFQESACSTNNFYDWVAMSCRACHQNCNTCHGPEATDCNSCRSPLMFHPYLQACLSCCVGSSQDTTSCCKCDISKGKCIVGASKNQKGEKGFGDATVILTVVVVVIALVIILLAAVIFFMLRNNQTTLNKIQTEKLSSVKYERLAQNDI